MKIKFEPYNPEWELSFKHLKKDLNRLIGFLNPQIEHVGSTSVEGLPAKPIIDILVGLESEEDLDKVIAPLIANGYIYYEIYNQYLPDRRFFVKHRINREELFLPSIFRDGDEVPSDTNEHDHRLAHIHIWPRSSAHWTRHIAFRKYLRNHPEVKNEYGNLKTNLSLREWRDGNDYNEAKDAFIKEEEQKAIDWYQRINK